MTLLDRAIVRVLPAVPRPLVQRLSSRYIAGPTLADARRVVAELNAHGKMATVDVLGEEITQASETEAIADEYVAALDAFERDGLDANVSVKPTALGLNLDYDLCKRNVERVDRGRRADEPLRPHRHGGRVDDGRHAAALPRAARRGPSARRRRCSRPR